MILQVYATITLQLLHRIAEFNRLNRSHVAVLLNELHFELILYKTDELAGYRPHDTSQTWSHTQIRTI